MSKSHDLKTLPKFYQDTYWKRKKFELRKNDRDFQVGDLLVLKEWDDSTQTYTGREFYANVTYILHNFPGLKDGYVVLGIK